MILFTASLISGCASEIWHMQEIAADKAPVAPAPGKAAVVFLRPSGDGSAQQSFVFEVKDNRSLLVGLLAAKTKVAYQVEPGKRLFMLDRMEFMTADLLPNRTYYVLLAPRTENFLRGGLHFVLEPVRGKEMDSSEFKSSLADCRWVEKTDASENWYRNIAAYHESQRAKYYADWVTKPEPEKPYLLQGDGR